MPLSQSDPYHSKASRLSEIAGRQKETARQMGNMISFQYFENQEKMWQHWAGLNPGSNMNTGDAYNFGRGPQIVDTDSELAWLNDPRAGTVANGAAYRNAFGGDYYLQAPSPLGGTDPIDDYNINENSYVKRGSPFSAYNNGDMRTQGDWNLLSGDHTISNKDAFSAVARLFAYNPNVGTPTPQAVSNQPTAPPMAQPAYPQAAPYGSMPFVPLKSGYGMGQPDQWFGYKTGGFSLLGNPRLSY